MSLNQLQDFYKQTISVACGAGAVNIYVTTKPTVSNGYCVISPSNTSLREIVRYTGTGTDGTGDYITIADVADRGLGGTTAQSHIVGESIRMNVTSLHWADMITEMALKYGAGSIVPNPTLSSDVANKAYVDLASFLGGSPADTITLGVMRASYSADVTIGVATITIASPAVISYTAHGLTENDFVKFSTTGALPTGITAGVTYYVIATGLTANAFQISATFGGSAVNTSGSQSGVHTLTKNTPVGLSVTDPRVLTQNENNAVAGKSTSGVGSFNLLLDEAMLYGGSTTDQSQATQNTALRVGEADATGKFRRIAQSFVVAKTPVLSVKLWKKANTGTFTGDVVVSIQADNSGAPSGTDLVSVTIANATYNALSAEAEFTATFASAYALTLGSTYWIVVTPSTADNSNYINLGYWNASVYGSGALYRYNVTDGQVAVTGDLYFVTVINPNGKIATVDANGKLGAYDGSNLTGIAQAKGSYTASGDILQNDIVYVSASDTIKTLYATAMGTGTAITTSPTTNNANKSLPTSVVGKYLHISGGDIDNAGTLFAQVRTMNAGETDFSNGSDQAVFNTSNGTRCFDVCLINTDKYFFIYQKDNAGAAGGIACKVATVSGTTVTVGSEQSIETNGALGGAVACAKIDTDKVAIFYRKDSDQDLYVQILTISGTTITTNTAVLVKAAGDNWSCITADQLTTNSAIVVYNSGTSSNLFSVTITVSGTTPSVGAENTLIASVQNWVYTHIKAISSTKVLMIHSNSSPVNDQCSILTVSGATVTKGSDLAVGSGRYSHYHGFNIISSKYALIACYQGNTSYRIDYLDISGATPVSLGNQTFSFGTTSNFHQGVAIVKVAPWTYMVAGGRVTDGDCLVKMTPASSARIGIAESAIANGVAGNALYRFQAHTLSGITLVAGSLYYVDDTGQPTANYSVTAPALGIAISSSKILLQ